MIKGEVGLDNVPWIPIELAGKEWRATIDTGFNGDLELPDSSRNALNARFVGRTRFLLAAGKLAEEDTYLVEFPFNGESVLAEATFTPGPGYSSARECCVLIIWKYIFPTGWCV